MAKCRQCGKETSAETLTFNFMTCSAACLVASVGPTPKTTQVKRSRKGAA